MTAKQPNFLVIVADDLGYSDIAPFGGEIRTPVLDSLAEDGIRLTNFYTASACSPTRSMLLSGTDNHIAGLGQMDEQLHRNRDYYADKPGYEGYLNWRVAALSEILQDAGYHTMMSGKWHLGFTKDVAPCSRGFDRSFSFLPGSGNHHGWEPQLKDDEFRVGFMKTKGLWMDEDQWIDIDTDLPKVFYSTTSFTDRMIQYLRERESDQGLKKKPFFGYLPFTAPHWPLQAPRSVVERYRGMYDDGPAELTKQRLERMERLGLIGKCVETPPPMGLVGPEWEEMSEEERAESARKMEIFAAMVDLIDQNIGRVVEQLKETDELDNTFILFMSDNGAEGAVIEAIPVMGEAVTMKNIINKHYDNRFENLGEKTSFCYYGPRWASAAMAPSRGFKTWILEGGIRCPCLIRYPKLAAQGGSITHAFTTVMDVLPTILDLAGVKHPGTAFRGREVVEPCGKSWVKHFNTLGDGKNESSVHGDKFHVHGWELFGQRAIRSGFLKAVWIPPPKGNGEWELYNLETDVGEMHNLAEKEPDTLKELIKEWEEYFAQTGMVEYWSRPHTGRPLPPTTR